MDNDMNQENSNYINNEGVSQIPQGPVEQPIQVVQQPVQSEPVAPWTAQVEPAQEAQPPVQSEPVAPWTAQVEPAQEVKEKTEGTGNDSNKVGELLSEEDQEYISSLSPVNVYAEDDDQNNNIVLPTNAVEPQIMDNIQMVEIPEVQKKVEEPDKGSKGLIFPIIFLFLLLAGAVWFLYSNDVKSRDNKTSNNESNVESNSNKKSENETSNSNVSETSNIVNSNVSSETSNIVNSNVQQNSNTTASNRATSNTATSNVAKSNTTTSNTNK